MRIAVRLCGALAALAVLLAVHPAAGRANCPPVGANQLCYDEPAIGQHATNTGYTFPAGSHVQIAANGCEQTGGSGETWKRYVNPDPPSTPSAYHGLAGIYSSVGGPTTLELTRIQGIQGTFYRVTTQSYLQVGFEDTDYSDNNYGSHDDGNGQCAWDTTGSPISGTYYNSAWGYSGPAYILLTVNPNVAPSVTATQPPAYVSGTTALTGTAGDADGDTLTYHVLIDGGDVSGSQAGASYSWNSRTVADGSHTLTLRAADPYTSTTSAARTFNVDNTSPTVAIASGPSNQTFGPHTTQTWTFTMSDGAGSGIQGPQCRLDGAPVSCTSASTHSVSNLPGGTHTFSVQATDKLGHLSNADSRTFAIDATPPETTVLTGPAEGASTTDATVTYALAASEPSSSFLCRVYAEAAPIQPTFAPCSDGAVDTVSNLTPAAYVFEAEAVDAYGNTDATPVVRHFTIASPPSDGGGDTNGGGSTGGDGSGGGPTPGGDSGGGAGGGTTGAGGSGGATLGGGAPIAPTTPPPPQAQPAIHATLAYAYKSPTRLKSLTLKHLPAGATVRVTCRGRCPKALRRAYTKRRVAGSLSLTVLVRRGLKPGLRLTIVVSKPGWKTMTKTFRIPRGRLVAGG